MKTTAIPRAEILTLVPHQGAMCLWDEVVEFDARSIRLRAFNHRDAVHPLRHRDRLHAVHLGEYGAQAMAVHGGLLARVAGGGVKPGMLVALRDLVLHVSRIDDLPGALEAQAQCLMADASGSQYRFLITHDGTTLASGRAAVLHSLPGESA
ncbi:phosphotransferase [Lysobacter changpingensis]|jgi:predicted hotdog family 3-hydroxylacyl-ACP dehydratase|uniref:phosphotransferase n=1 Tax=Lysobacter changpingensis TaxID=2792784 RepID=UPI001A8CF296|nr:phosphotransferase [Lysobacter changpingensis]